MSFLKKHRNLIIFASIVLLTIVAYLSFTNTKYFETFTNWAKQNMLLYFTVLVILKIIGIVWPPLPGGVLTVGSIPVIGWFYAWLADALGGIIGSCLAFYLGKKYGYTFIEKLFDKGVVDKLKNIKLNREREVEAIIVMRIFYGTISEVISYGSGLLNVKFKNFLAGTLIYFGFGAIIFYFVNNVFNGTSMVLNILIFGFAIFLFFKIKGRYFE